MSTQDAWRNEQVTPDDFPVLWPATTRWLDNDSYGHLNNANYIHYMEEAAFQASTAVGYSKARYEAMGTLWLARETRRAMGRA